MSGTTLTPYRATMRRLCQNAALLSLLLSICASTLLTLRHLELLALPAARSGASVISSDASVTGWGWQWPIVFVELAAAIGLATAFLYDQWQPSPATLVISRLTGVASAALLYISWRSGVICPYWLVSHLALLSYSIAAEIAARDESSSFQNLAARNVGSCVSLITAAALVSASLAVGKTEIARQKTEEADRRAAVAANIEKTSLAEPQTPGVQDVPGAMERLEQRILAATVRVENLDHSQVGSGVVVGKSGLWVYVLTAEHVVNRAAHITVSRSSPKSLAADTSLPAELVASSKEADLAVIRISATDYTGGQLQIANPERGESKLPITVLFAGVNAEGRPECFKAEVAEKRRLELGEAGLSGWMWRLNTSAEKGFSGGPLVTTDGYLIGISSGVAGNSAYFSHISEMRKLFAGNGLTWLADDR